MKTKLLFILSLLMITLSGVAQEFEFKGPDGNKLKYEITDAVKSEVMVTWPGKDEYSKAYEYEHIVIPEQVSYKEKVYTVTGVKGGFYRSKKLKTITIPKTIQRLSSPSQSEQLESIYISDLAAWCKCSTHASLFYPKTGLYLNGELVTNLVVPSTVDEFRCSFWGYRFLETVIIPPSVKKLANYAFYNCRNLKSVRVLGNNLTDIGKSSFDDCIALEECKLPNSVTLIPESAFSGCKYLKEFTIPSSANAISVKAFYGCESLSSLVIPFSVKSIGVGAFEKCKALERIDIKNPSIKLYPYAFSNCESLIVVKGLGEKSDVGTKAFSFVNYLSYTDLNKLHKNYETGKTTPFSFEQYKKTFSYFATGKVEENLAQWQKKSEFETTEQWKQRVTTGNRDKEVKRIIEQLRQDYIAKMKVNDPSPTLLAYDADKGVQPVQIGSETMYVKVPVSEAQKFKMNFKPEYIHTDYDIANDRLAVVGRSCIVNGKKYETTNTYAKADNLNDFALNLPPLEIDFGNNSNASASNKPAQSKTTDRTIDQNIPASGVTNTNTFAVIIGNENYSMVAKVPFAKNDAQVFAEYCRKTLGIPSNNVRSYGDATFGMMKNAIKDIQNIANAYNGNINVIFYYAGHGIPNEHSKDAFLLPIDADGKETDICYPVSKLYQELGGLNAKQVVVLMDACFSGAQRGDGMLASARGVALKPKAAAPQGKMVVFSAASSDETAYPYNEKGHGMFTYFLLKKLRDTKGNCTLQEIGEYIKQNVTQQSVVINRKLQTPTVIPSQALMNNWQTMKLK